MGFFIGGKEMKKIKIGDNDYVIRNFMLNLDLTNGALLIYALLYTKSNEGKTSVVLSTKSISDLTNISTRRVISSINNLIDKGIIIKKKVKEPNTNITINKYESL